MRCELTLKAHLCGRGLSCVPARTLQASFNVQAQVNRDYENLKRLDVGGSRTIEEPNPEDQTAEGEGSRDDDEGAARRNELKDSVKKLQASLAEQQAQLARLLKLQEGVVKATLSKRQAENLLAESGQS